MAIDRDEAIEAQSKLAFSEFQKLAADDPAAASAVLDIIFMLLPEDEQLKLIEQIRAAAGQ